MRNIGLGWQKAAVFGLVSLCSGWLCSPAVGASLDNSTRPNIIYILADDLGYGDLGSYGQRRIRTPSLDRMASEGMRFTSHYAGSTVCGPSRASLLTGLHTGHSPIRGNPKWTASGQPVDLSAGDITLAKVLQQAGYHTAAIGKWGLAERREPRENAVNPAMPLQQGFDYFFGYKHHLDAHYYYWPTLYRNNHPYVLRENDHLTNKGIYTHDLFTEQALAVVEQGAGREQPFFLYLAYTIPHLALTVPEDSKAPYQKLGWPQRKMKTDGHYKNDPEGHTAYAGMVSRMDRDIGRLFERLEELGIDDNTLVIFTSDNGHEYDRGFFDSNGPLRGKKRDLYEGGIRVPMIARWPGSIKAGATTDHLSAFWDMMPTFCELAAADHCPQGDGISLLPTLLGSPQKQQQHAYLYWEFNEGQGPIQAVRRGQWKLISFKGKPPELYDLDCDLGESRNVAGQYPQVVAELTRLRDKARSEHPEFPLRRMPNPWGK